MAVPRRPLYRYCLNASDVIARENGASELTRPAVVGQVLWRFITDEPTRALYREIHAHVRSAGSRITVPFRCDSPTLQRHMELTIDSRPDHQLCYECSIIRVVPQDYQGVLDSKRKRSRDFLTMCSFCKRSLIEPSGWLELTDISFALRLYRRESFPQLRYTVCPECTALSPRGLDQPLRPGEPVE
jgi:hypothetical protein